MDTTLCFSAISMKENNVFKDFLFASLSNIPFQIGVTLNPIALRKAKIVYNFGLSECNRVEKKHEFAPLGIQIVYNFGLSECNRVKKNRVKKT